VKATQSPGQSHKSYCHGNKNCITGTDNKVRELAPCARRGSSERKPQYGLMTLAFQRFTSVLLLIYGSLFLSGVYYCLSVFWYAVARMSELELDACEGVFS
jgi:hypothetical protein